jgi:hypothetical protein
MASKLSKSPSSPKPAKHISGKGVPGHQVSEPTYHKGTGTPGWASKPAAAAAKKAK